MTKTEKAVQSTDWKKGRKLLREASKAFVRFQVARGVFRLQILRLAVTPLAFWTLVGAGYIWMDRRGLGIVVGGAVLAWVVLMLPPFLLQLGLIVDVLNYGLTGRVLVFPIFKGATDRARARKQEAGMKGTPVLARLSAYAGLTSPFSGLALWCYGVLMRVPAAEYALESVKADEHATVVLAPKRESWRGAQREYWNVLGESTTGELMHV